MRIRGILIGLAVLVATLLGLATIAFFVGINARGENAAKCLNHDLAACTALIQSGNETTANLAVDYFNRGVTYGRKGLHQEAIADYTKAIALNPDFAIAYDNRAFHYDSKGHYDEAIADYTKAIALKPDYALRLCWARLRLRQKRSPGRSHRRLHPGDRPQSEIRCRLLRSGQQLCQEGPGR